MKTLETLPANDSLESENISTNDNEIFELKFTEADLITLCCTLEDALTRPCSSDGSAWTCLGVDQASALLRRLSILANGEPQRPLPWTRDQRYDWREAWITTRRALGLPGRLPTLDKAPL